MSNYVDSNQEHKGRSSSFERPKNAAMSASKGTLALTDNRPETTQRKLHNDHRTSVNDLSSSFLSNVNSVENTAFDTSITGPVLQPIWTADGFKERIQAISDVGRSKSQKVSDVFFERPVYSEYPRFKTIIFLLRSYVDIEEEVGNESEKDRMALLQGMEQEAYDWYAENKAQSTLGGIVKNPYNEVMIAFINDVQDERTNVVERTVAGGGEIWVPGIEDMSAGNQQNIQDLWTSLTTNTGKLRVNNGSDDHDKAKVYAQYLQLMEGASGRSVLDRSNKGNPLHPEHHITINPDVGGEPMADPIDSVTSHRRLPPTDPRFLASLDPTQQLELTKAERNTSVAGPGSGSRIPFQDAPETGNYYALGNDWDSSNDTGSLELLPSFLVLGHELGHAIRQQHGTSTVRFQSPFHNTAEGNAWHNTEEHAVITGPEKRIREEHNLGGRKFHRAIA